MLPEEVVAQPAALLSALGARTKAGLNCVPSLWKAMLYAVHSGQGHRSERKRSSTYCSAVNSSVRSWSTVPFLRCPI